MEKGVDFSGPVAFMTILAVLTVLRGVPQPLLDLRSRLPCSQKWEKMAEKWVLAPREKSIFRPVFPISGPKPEMGSVQGNRDRNA